MKHPGLFQSIRLERMALAAVLILAVGTSNLRSLVSWDLYPVGQRFSEQAWLEMWGWWVATLLVFWLLMREGRVAEYFGDWQRQPLLLVFLTVCVASVLWSVHPLVTAFRVAGLLCATAVAAYLGMRCRTPDLLRGLAWICAVVVVSSAYMVLTDPLLGKQRFYGPDVWRGIFWNKNHLGSVAALCSAVLLLRIIDLRAARVGLERVLFACAYLLALLAVYKSRSGTGGLVALILHLLVLLALLWLRFGLRIRPGHYLQLMAGAVLLAGIALANIESIFGIFNKNLALSGRWDLWNYLLWDVIPRHLLLGQGLGALWGDPEFRALGAVALGMVPLIGDNGFIDIALGVGVIGLGAFLLVYYRTWVGAFGLLVRDKSVAAILPPTIMCASLFSNLGFSLLMEIEVFYWGLIVVVLFSTSTVQRDAGR